MQRDWQECEQDGQRGHHAERGEHAEFLDRQNIAGVQRTKTNGRRERSQRAGTPTKVDSGFRRAVITPAFVREFEYV